jgi:hypothetical protein
LNGAQDAPEKSREKAHFDFNLVIETLLIDRWKIGRLQDWRIGFPHPSILPFPSILPIPLDQAQSAAVAFQSRYRDSFD